MNNEMLRILADMRREARSRGAETRSLPGFILQRMLTEWADNLEQATQTEAAKATSLQMPGATISSYYLPDGASLKGEKLWDGSWRWVVTRPSGLYLGRAGWEAHPECGDPDFDAIRERLYYESAQEAYAAWVADAKAAEARALTYADEEQPE